MYEPHEDSDMSEADVMLMQAIASIGLMRARPEDLERHRSKALSALYSLTEAMESGEIPHFGAIGVGSDLVANFVAELDDSSAFDASQDEFEAQFSAGMPMLSIVPDPEDGEV